MTNGDKIRSDRRLELDDVDLAGLVCTEQPDCDKCQYLQNGHCMVMDWIQEDVNDGDQKG